MNKKQLPLFLLIVMSLFFSLIFGITPTQAGVNTIPRYGFLSGTTAWAMLEAFPAAGSPINCRITSYTSPATSINVIGWTWWQCDLLSSGIVTHTYQGSPRAVSGSSTSALISSSYIPPGVNGYRAIGMHDFNHTGANPSPWRPYHWANN